MTASNSSGGHGDTARDLLDLVGGADNVTSVEHCISRLRLGIADRSGIQDQQVRDHAAVLGVVDDDTYQIVLGPGAVGRVSEAFSALVEAERSTETTDGGSTTSTETEDAAAGGGTPTDAEALAAAGAAKKAEQKKRNATPFKLFLRRIANIFVPLIPALIACGIVAGVNGLLENLGWLSGAQPALNAISSGFLGLIAVFVGMNTAKEFGGTPVLGGAVAAIIPFAGVSDIEVFGDKLAPGQGGVIGALGAAVLCAYLERWCRTWVPEALDVLLTPTIAVLISGMVTIFGLMYVAGEIATGIGTGANWLLANAGAAAGLILGGLFLPMVMLGLHQALIPIHTTLIQQDGYTVLLPILSMAGAGQVGAAIAIYLRLKHNQSIRNTIRSALPAGFLGVGEPLIYGVSLPLGRPFITACLGGAVGGGFLGLVSQLGNSFGSTAIGPSGWALFPLLQGNHGIGATVAVYAAGLLVSYLVGFGCTYAFGFSSSMLLELNQPPTAADAAAPTETLAAPTTPVNAAGGTESDAEPTAAAEPKDPPAEDVPARTG